MNWSEFFHMGGYAAFVWPAYALAALVLIVNVVAPIRSHRKIHRELRRAQQARAAGSSATRVDPGSS